MDNKKVLQKKQEDIALSRALLWFAAAMVLELLVLLVNKYYVSFTVDSVSIAIAAAISHVLKGTAALGLLGAVACGVWCRKCAQAAGDPPFLPVLLGASLLVVGVGSVLIIGFYAAAIQLLYVLIPSGAVLALVYYLYQKEFFLSALGVGVGLLGLWLVRKNTGAHDLIVTLYVIVAAVILLCMILLAAKLKKDQGVLTVKGKQYVLFAKQANLVPVILSCAISVLTMAVALPFGSVAAFYLLFVLVAWLFVLLVYYTVKMM